MSAEHVEPAASHRLEAQGLVLAYGDRPVVDDLSVAIPDGRITVVVGANGCGKSTLLRGMARLVTPVRGAVLLDGKSVHRTPSKEVARVLGLLPQAPVAPEGITVTDLVGRGRYPHQGWFRHWTAADDEAVARALEATGTTELADRRIEDMSGGQRQRVWIAMALAQETDVLLLDEPTTYLDLAHQIEVLDLLTDLNRQRGTTIVVVMHDLNLACRYADHVIAMTDGAVTAQGAPRAVVTPELVQRVFGIASVVVDDPLSGTPTVVPVGRHHCAASA
ncbi:ABC transporter ATP-binding protein [Microlunatus flavus]|uniref:Iron complex transport system ATP-binding protein n=1 Tax=Microlunatus flavus TaxID=1036181 RepID=A0A1H9AMP3_9ACTN|nr:ABC transporter ATP-binding protein [Microlunatus flavus]SEP77990.1 iron complex transport system ATP-binding protein [Microlunatus flavus]